MYNNNQLNVDLSTVPVINLEQDIAIRFSCFLPSDSREQRSYVGILGIAAHSVVVSPRLVYG